MIVQATGLQGTLSKNENRIMTAVGEGKANIRLIIENSGVKSNSFVLDYVKRLLDKGYLCQV